MDERNRTSSKDEQWRVDPHDVRRYRKLVQQRERVGPLGKLSRYGFVAVALVAAFLVYWNFDTLRGITVDFSALTSLFDDDSGTDRSGRSLPSTELKTEEFEAPRVAGADAPTTVGDAPAAEARVAETPVARARLPTAEAETPVVRAELPAAETEAPPSVATDEPSQDDNLAESRAPPPPPAPPPAPEPPPGPETFEFGLATVNVSEADAGAHVLILRSGDRRRASSITWWTEDGTAKAGVDYADLGKVVEKFAAGEQNRAINIPIVGDHQVEGPERFYVYLAPSEGSDSAGDAAQKLEVVIND
jgi:hypothetical protein